MRILNKTRNTVVASKPVLADSFLSRMVGLLAHQRLPEDEALIITHCQSIHMLFMRFPIDVIFIGKENKVVGLIPGIKPFQFSPIFLNAQYAIEVAPGTIPQSRTALGDIFFLENGPALVK